MRVTVWIVVTAWFASLAAADPPLPPLVEEGERFEDVEALLTGVTGGTFSGYVAFSPGGKTDRDDERYQALAQRYL